MIDLLLVRHGESIRNHASLLAHQGRPETLAKQLDSPDDYEPGWPLTEMGWRQAKETGDWIRGEFGDSPDLAYCSPYLRTIQTAKGLGLGIEFQEDWRLRERHWGETAGTSYTVDQYLADLSKCGLPDWRSGYPGGESVDDLVVNVRSFVLDHLRGLSNAQVLIVTHGGTMKAFQTVLQGGQDQPKESAIPNASVLHYCLKHIDADGHAHGDFKRACPWNADSPHMEWQHFG